MSRRRDGLGDVFGGADEASSNDVSAMANASFGGADLPSSGRITAKPIGLFKIRPDFRQPRKAIPLGVMNQWDRDVSTLPDLLERWETMAVSAYEGALSQDDRRDFEWDLSALLTGVSDPLPKPVDKDGNAIPLPAIFDNFMALVSLGASIKAEGLTNPITVSERGDGYLLETGERRWLAHHLLLAKGFEEFGRIPCRVVEHSVWRQASENNTREPLNAIGMARQGALLIMDMYGMENFHSYEEMVKPGMCDRAYYAQVANGYKFSVSESEQERFLSATGLASDSVWSRYRRLLMPIQAKHLPDDVDVDLSAINDDIWMSADFEDWSEGAIREAYLSVIADYKPVPSPAESLPNGKLSPSEWGVGMRVSHQRYGVGEVVKVNGDAIHVRFEVDGNVIALSDGLLSPATNPPSNSPHSSVVGGEQSAPWRDNPSENGGTSTGGNYRGRVKLEDWVKFGDGYEGRVVGISGDTLHVAPRGASSGRYRHIDDVVALGSRFASPNEARPPSDRPSPAQRGEGDFGGAPVRRDERDYDGAEYYQQKQEAETARVNRMAAYEAPVHGAAVVDPGMADGKLLNLWIAQADILNLQSVVEILREFRELNQAEAEAMASAGKWEAYITSVDSAIGRLLNAMNARRKDYMGEVFGRYS